jgi:hypothetical protein
MFQPGFASRQPDRCSEDQCRMQNACTGKKHCENKQSKEGCTSNGCNPFMACWCGNFFMTENAFSSCTPVAKFASEFMIRDEKKTIGVALECWHPPEMV